jgi:non-homologous end joining protein Ku
MFKRDDMETDRIYYVWNSNKYVITPDGVGCFWYDTIDEALDATDKVGKIFVIEELED